MAKQTVNIGTLADDGTGDPARTAFDKINDNFDELYTGVVPATGADSYVLNAADNSVEATVVSSVNLAAKTSHIGKVNGLLSGSDFNPGWSADSGYVAGAASYSAIIGGYDQIVNAIGSSIMLSNHSMISYGTEGHNQIAGGSYCWISGSAGRSGIYASHDSSIQGGIYNAILGGDGIDITTSGSYNACVAGRNNSITGTNSYNALIGGYTNTCSGAYCAILGGYSHSITNSYSAAVAGYDNTITSNYAATIGGQAHTVSATNAAAIGGHTNTVQAPYAVAFGKEVYTNNASGIYHGRGKLVEAGDAQTITTTMAVRTTNATLTNMTCTDGAFIELNDTKVTTGTATVLLVGMRDGSADGNNDGDYTQVAYSGTFGFFWNGTNGFLFNASTQTAVTSVPTLDLTLISQTNNDFTAGAAPHVAINTGALRIKVTGIANIKINWVAKLDLAMTLVS